MKKTLRMAVMLLLAAIMLTTSVGATSAYSTYTYSSEQFVLDSPDAYVVDSVITGADAEIQLSRPTDIEVDPEGNIYIVDADRACVYALSPSFKLRFTISAFNNEHGVPDTFINPQGVFINDKYIYVCDTDSARIVMFDLEGNFVKTIAAPVSNLFEDDAIYKPVAVAVDEYGRLFIVSSTTYQGIIVMSDEGDFYGFIGAQMTAASGVNAIWEKIGELFGATDDDEKNLSTEYNNITVDENNFVYATTSTIDKSLQQAAITSKSGTYAPVRKYNASGEDVLRRNGFFGPGGEVILSDSVGSSKTEASTIVDAAVGPEGTWSIVDQDRSKIFTYDSEGNLLFAFGDSGSMKGNLATAAGIVYQGDKLLALDKGNLNVTVYRRTEYGDILINAMKNQNERNYDSAVEDWKEILRRNNNFDVAYIGIGNSLIRSGDYDLAMEYFKSAHNLAGYGSAYKEVRKEWASKFFIVIPVIIVVVFVGLTYLISYCGKVNKKAALQVGTKTLGQELAYGFHIMTHPFDGFWDLKHEKRGSLRSAFIILMVTIMAFFYQSIGQGYIFKGGDTSYSSIYTSVISVAVPLVLFVVGNWCLTTLFDGEGKFGDIFTATCYALFPLPFFIIPSVILSNFLVADEKGIITLFLAIGYIWAGMLLFVGMMSTHGYTLGKNIAIIFFTVIAMALIMFLILLFTTLMGQIVDLISSVVNEIGYRL